jgi:EmrB/QacA subfamily drug resistance transporter
MVKTTLEEQNNSVKVGSRLTTSTRWALAALSLSVLLPSLGTSASNVALPTFATVYEAPFQEVQWIVLAYLLVTTSLIVGVGRLGDMIGRRRLLIAGTFLFTVSSALCAAAPTLWMLIAARAIQGLGAAAMLALTMASVGEIVPKERSGTAMGLLGTMSAVGTALGPALGGILIVGAGWPAIFLINIPLGILTLLLLHRFLPADRLPRKGHQVGFDYLGTLFLALSLTTYSLATTIGRGRFGAENLVLLLVAATGVVLFVMAELRTGSPLIDLASLRDPVLSSGLAMSALVTAVVMATLVVGPFYLSEALELDAVGVGLVMSCGPVIAALTGVPAGRFVDRFGAHRMMVVGLTGMVAGSSILPLMPVDVGVIGYIIPLASITSGYALFQAANNTAVMADVSADRRGVVSGMLTMARNLGLVTGASVMAALYAVASQTSGSAENAREAAARGMSVTFTVAAVIILLSLAIALGSRAFSKGQVLSGRDLGRLRVRSS